MFQDEDSKPVSIVELHVIFYDVFEELSNRKNKLIGKDVRIEEEYSICGSCRQVSTTQSSNKGVSELCITTSNKWINT